MLKVLAVAAVIGGVVFGVALYKDFVSADVNVGITPKARQAVISGLDAAQGGANTGIDAAKQKIDNKKK
jgi:hypothetical protein